MKKQFTEQKLFIFVTYPRDASQPPHSQPMESHEFTALLYIYEDGTIAVHGKDINGLFVEVESVVDLKPELDAVIPCLLELNHGLSDEEISNVTIRLIVKIVYEEQLVEADPIPIPFFIGQKQNTNPRQLQYA